MILALDPGGTTGLAWMHGTNGAVRTMQMGPDEHHEELWNFMRVYTPTAIVCESFTYRNGLAKADLIPCEYIGLVKLYAEKYCVPLYMQTPSMAKKFFSDDKLKAADLWITGKQHARDAVRHLMYYVTFTLKSERFLARPETD